MVKGDIVGASDVPTRLHSECLTGDVMGSLRCDCRDQLLEGLRRIQEMTTDLGLNLAGVERVLDLEEQLERASRRLEALERRSAEMRAEMEAEIERVRKSFRAELVPYKQTTDLIRADDARPGVRSIRVERDR